MGQFEHNGTLYEELPGGQARVIGPAPSAAPSASPAPMIVGQPNQALVQSRNLQNQNAQVNIQQGQAQLANQPLTTENLKTNIAQGQNSIADSALDNKSKLRNDFNALPPVKTYQEYLPVLDGAIGAPDNAQGDLAVLISFSKAMDPSTGVKEGETAMAGATASTVEQAKVWAEKVSQGQRLPPNVRTQFIEAMRAKGRAFNKGYSQAYERYSDLAQRYGADPKEIVGDHLGDAFVGGEEAYVRRHNDPKQPIDPAGAGDIGFNQDPSNAPKLAPEQLQQLNAFMASKPKGSLNPAEIEAVYFGMTGQHLQNAQAWAEHFNKYGTFSSDIAEPKPDISQMRQGDEVVDPIMRGVADTATLGLSEELAAGIDMLGNDKSYGQNLATENAIRDYDQEHNFGKRMAGQLAGGVALPTFGANSIRALSGVGAGYGAAYGAGSTDGGVVDRAVGALKGGVAGGATGAALGAVVPALTRAAVGAGRRIAGPSTPRQTALLQAGADEQVPINMSDVYPEVRNTVSTLETIPGASGPVRQGIEAGRDAIEGRVQQLGRGGTARENMGEAVRGAGERYVRRSREQANRLYGVARREADNALITPQATMQTIAGLVRQEGQVPGGTRAGAVIQRYADAFDAGGPITIDGARAMRSELLSRLRDDGGLSRAAATRITGQIMGAVNQDIERSLGQAGRNHAVQAYRIADRFYAERMDEIDNVVQKFLGTEQSPKSPEQAVQLMRTMASPKGDTGRMTRMLSHLTPDERRDFAATLVEPLGRRSAEEPFSPATFIQNVRSISPAARRVIFGTDGERSIQNLVRLSNAKRDTVGALNNSRSGQVGNYRTMLSAVLFGLPGGGAIMSMGAGLNGATGAVGGTVIGGAALGAARVVSRALMNEQFTRLLAQAPATANPAAINNHIGRIRAVAARDPNVRAVVEAAEKQLMKFANDNGTSRAVASDGSEQDNQR